jgi:UDP-sugar transporter A1/2/3
MVAPAAATAASLSPVALGYMGLLALQFGLQPIVTRAFAPKTICRSTVVMMQEVAKLITSAALLAGSAGAWQSAVVGWSVHTWALVAGIPAGLYVIQNYCSLVAYQNLSPVTYNVLNQTKTLSAAFFCFLFMGRMQSRLQIFALFVLSMAALVLEKVVPLPWKTGGSTVATTTTTTSEEDSTTTSDKKKAKMLHLTGGVLPVLAASAISGMTGVSS